MGHTDPGSVGVLPAYSSCLTQPLAECALHRCAYETVAAVNTFGFSLAVCCPGWCSIYFVNSSHPFSLLPGKVETFQRKTELFFSIGTNDKPGGPHYILRWTSPQVIKETHKPLGDWRYSYMQ